MKPSCNSFHQEASPLGLGRNPSTFLISIICMLLASSETQALSINFDTSSLAGISGRLEFNLLDGDSIFGNNTATINGNSITDPDVFNLDFTPLGNHINFDISFTNNFSGTGDHDLFVINLLDSVTNLTLVDTDLDALAAPVPYQDAHLVIDLVDGSILLPTNTNPQVDVSIPEPGTLTLLFFGMGFLTRRIAH